MKKLIINISLVLILVVLPATSWGQYLSRARVGKAIFLNADGMPPTAVWEIGRSLVDPTTGATIRHHVRGGNGNNLDVNSKVPNRFIIAPTDYSAGLDWASAMGLNSLDNSNLFPTATSLPTAKVGCRGYAVPSGLSYFKDGFTWRLPTQRELYFIWLFREPLDQFFIKDEDYGENGKTPLMQHLSGIYWSSTESEATTAFSLDFDNLQGYNNAKATKYKVRCVADY